MTLRVRSPHFAPQLGRRTSGIEQCWCSAAGERICSISGEFVALSKDKDDVTLPSWLLNAKPGQAPSAVVVPCHSGAALSPEGTPSASVPGWPALAQVAAG